LAANKLDPEGNPTAPGITRLRPATARAPRSVFVVLTHSDELLEQIGQVLDEDSEVRHADNEEEARQFADPRHATVMLVDAREQVDPALVVERLHATDGSTVIVVFAPAGSVTEVARAIRGSAAFAVLPMPVETEKTRAVLQGAGEEALARRALVTPVLEAAPERPAVVPPLREARVEPVAEIEPVALPVAGGATPRSGSVPRAALAAAAGLLVAATAAWFYLRDTGEPAAPPEAAVAASRPQQQLSTASKEELLDRARVAFHERRYSDPDGDSALYFYRSVLAQDPQDAEAREGLDRIGSVLDGRLKSALAEQRTEDAERTLQQLRLIRPDDPALAATEARMVENRIGAALARGDLAQAATLLRAATASGVAPERLAPQREQLTRLESAERAEQLARLVSARIREGQLLAPAGDSAKHHLDQLLRLPNGKRLGADASAELARAFAERGRRAADQGQGSEADRWFAEARALGHTPERTVAAPAAAVATTPVLPVTPAAPQPMEPPVATRPDPAGAQAPRSDPPAAAPPQPQASPADFKRTRFVPPTYPPQALARRQEGEVRVRITVDTSGRVVDASVESATPAGVFDQAALNAVRKWRFEPIVKNGRPIEGSVVTTIRFQPEEAQR
jgi:protein TonB